MRKQKDIPWTARRGKLHLRVLEKLRRDRKQKRDYPVVDKHWANCISSVAVPLEADPD